MKTKSFKKLSFVLIVAMVLSVFAPAAGAFAAKAPKLNSTKKYLHLDVDKKNEFNFNISNKGKGWKYEWESKNEDVAVVNAKNGVVTATGVGTTKVSVEITDADKEDVATLTATVVVRDNIEEVTISNPVEKLAVGESKDYNRSFKTVSGSNKKTSAVTRWTVEPDTATINDKGVFVATEAGEYTVTALSFQSKAKYNSWVKDPVKYAGYVLDTDTTKVVVAGSMVEAKQINADTVKVVFNSAMTDVDKNISVHQVIGTTNVKQIVKKVAVADDKKSAEVTLYVPFASGQTFVVEYTGLESVSFVSATTNVEDVAAVQITTSNVVINETKKVDFKLLNANGVDITTESLKARVTMKSSEGNGTYFNESTNEITIFNKEATTNITATFHTYKYDTTGNELGAVEGVATLIGVDKDATNITGLNAWTIVANDKEPNFGDVKQKLAADDSGLRLFAEFTTKTGSKDDKVNSSENPELFNFTTSDKNVLIIDGMGNLYPVKEGSAVVVVSYGSGDNKSPIGAIILNIGGKRAAGAFSLSTYNFTLSNSDTVNDSKVVEITLKDQFGDDFNYSKYKVDKITAPKDMAGDLTTTGEVAKGDGKITFAGIGKTAGDYAYKITVEGKSAVVSVKVVEAEGDVAYSRIELSSTSVDVKAKAGEAGKSVSIAVIGYNNKGAKVTKETLDGVKFKVEVTAPKAEWNDDDNRGTYTLSTITSGSAIDKAPTGLYKVSAFEYKVVNSDTGEKKWVPLNSASFTVTDSQIKPVLAETKTRLYEQSNVAIDVKTNDDLIQIAKDCFKFTLDGTEVSDITEVNAFGNSDEFNIKSVKIRQYIDGAFIIHEVNVGVTVSKK